MIVVMANIAEEDGVRRPIERIACLERRRAGRRPPRVEMRPVIPAEAGSPPAAVEPVGCFVMQARDIHRHALHQQGSALGQGLIPASGQLVQKILMAINRARGAARPDVLFKKRILTQDPHFIAASADPGSAAYRVMMVAMLTRAFLLSLCAGVLPAQVTFDRILHADKEPQNWLTY